MTVQIKVVGSTHGKFSRTGFSGSNRPLLMDRNLLNTLLKDASLNLKHIDSKTVGQPSLKIMNSEKSISNTHHSDNQIIQEAIVNSKDVVKQAIDSPNKLEMQDNQQNRDSIPTDVQELQTQNETLDLEENKVEKQEVDINHEKDTPKNVENSNIAPSYDVNNANTLNIKNEGPVQSDISRSVYDDNSGNDVSPQMAEESTSFSTVDNNQSENKQISQDNSTSLSENPATDLNNNKEDIDYSTQIDKKSTVSVRNVISNGNENIENKTTLNDQTELPSQGSSEIDASSLNNIQGTNIVQGVFDANLLSEKDKIIYKYLPPESKKSFEERHTRLQNSNTESATKTNQTLDTDNPQIATNTTSEQNKALNLPSTQENDKSLHTNKLSVNTSDNTVADSINEESSFIPKVSQSSIKHPSI